MFEPQEVPDKQTRKPCRFPDAWPTVGLVVTETIACPSSGTSLTFSLILKTTFSSVLSSLFQRPGNGGSHTGKGPAWSWTKWQCWDSSSGFYSAERLHISGWQCSWQWPWPVLEKKRVNNVNLNLYLYLFRLLSQQKHTPFSQVSWHSTQPWVGLLVLAWLLKMQELQQWAGNYKV